MGRISMPQGRGSQMHNRRDYAKIGKPVPENIDVSKSAQNVTFVDRDLREAYKEIFGEALREYNDKQKRADRRIDDYYDHIAKSKNGEKLFYEDVVQWGDMGDFVNSPVTAQKAKESLLEYIRAFEERNPNLRLIGAYIHMDEASPHLHLDYVPVATGYKQGMSMRNSLDRAMKEMGFAPDPKKQSKVNNATKLWKENERKVFAEICRDHGLEVEAEIKGRGRKSLSVEEYKEAKHEMIGEIEAEVQPLRDLKVEIDNIDNISTGKALKPGHVTIKKDDFEILKQQAKAYVANREEIETLRGRSKQLDQREQLLDDKEKKLNRALADTKSEKEKFQIAYDEQRHLNEIAEKLYKKNLTLVDEKKALINENTSLKAKNDEQEAEVEVRVQKAVEAAVKPLHDEIKSLNDDLSIVSSALSHLMQLMRYVVAMFAGKISRAFLNAGIKRGEQEMERAHFTNIPHSARVRPDISKDIVLDLRYKKGDEGKGLYDYDDRLIYRAESIAEAKEMFPKCNIKNEIERDRGYGD